MAVLTFYLGKKLHLDFRPVAGLGQVQLEIAGLDALLAMKGDASHQNDHGTVLLPLQAFACKGTIIMGIIAISMRKSFKKARKPLQGYRFFCDKEPLSSEQYSKKKENIVWSFEKKVVYLQRIFISRQDGYIY